MREIWLLSARLTALVLALLATVASSGCGKSGVKLYPVRGQVFFKDKPTEGAQVVFRPQEEPPSEETKAKQPLAYGTVAADGSFTLHTEHGEGAAAGDYVAFITWYGADPRDPEQHVSKLPVKYSDQSNPVLKATVKEEKNELPPFKLN